MFEQILGIPAHPLLVHAAVVFVPLLVVAALAYALVPRVRGRVGWLAVLLAIVAPAAAGLATASGDQLQRMLVARNYPPAVLNQVSGHREWGDRTLFSTILLAVLTLVFVFLSSGNRRVPALPTWVAHVLAAAVVVFGVITGYYVFQAGDSGAHAVWSGF